MFALLRKPDDRRREVLLLSPSTWGFAALLLVLSLVFLHVALDGDFAEDRGMVLRSLLLATAFGASGLAALLVVPGWTFEAPGRRITSWWSLLGRPGWRFFAKEHDGGRFVRLTVKHELRQARQKVVHSYPVRFEGKDASGPLEDGDGDVLPSASPAEGVLPLSLASFSDGHRAWRLARELAAFFGLALDDESLGPRIHRDADTVDLPLATRLEREGESEPPPPCPAPCRVRIEEHGEGVRAVLPPGGLRGQHSLAVLAGALATALLVFVVNPSGDAPSEGLSGLAWYLFVNLAVELLPLALTVVAAAVAENRIHVLVAHPERGLQVTSRLLGFSWSHVHGQEELVDLELLPAGEDNPARGRLFPHDPALLIRSRGRVELVGHGLSYPELERLRHALLLHLAPRRSESEEGED